MVGINISVSVVSFYYSSFSETIESPCAPLNIYLYFTKPSALTVAKHANCSVGV